ncbi:MAG: protein kinase [Anaerolineae bacterium]
MVQVGDRLGPYQILEKIGQGGMAAVYRARQQSVERDVALKVILRDIAGDPTAIQRFQREAKLIARLEHPHILPVYDFDGGHSPPYIVMRYLDGGTLKDWMVQGRLPHYEVVHLIQQICSALDYAHRQGIIHRDIKPSNILIDREGNAFVSDLGLARLTIHDSEGKQITETGMLMGTPDYMSPEQAIGLDDVDHRTDIYALGVMLFEMLAGSLPFTAASGTLMLVQHLQTPAPSILDFDPTLSPAIEGVLLRVLAKDKEDRYQSAQEFGEAASEALGITSTRSLMRSRDAGAHAIRHPRSSGKADSRVTLSEQNKTVVVLNANAAEYSAMLDQAVGAEAARQAMSDLWTAAEQLIEDYGGRLLTHTDYELLALWGTESAREDDSEQAIRAALGLQTILRELGSPFITDSELLPLNIGIHRGLALLSPHKKGGALSASGATMGFTNRLMQNAEGAILISHDVFRQVLGVFDILEEEPLKVRGRAERILTYRITAAKAHALHIPLRGVEGVETPMVGRESEFKLLQRALLTAVEDSETQVITIVSEAGIGKSRLFFEFDKWSELRPEEYESFNGRATPATTQRPYALLRDVIFTRFEVMGDDPPETALRKIEYGIFELVGWRDERAALIAYLVGVIAADDPHFEVLLSEATEARRRARLSFIQFITTLAKIAPVIFKLEDIHHADDASLDLLNDLFLADDTVQLLVIACARPTLYERRPSWGSGQPFHTRVDLKPLDKRESRELVLAILEQVPEVPRVLRDVLVERAEETRSIGRIGQNAHDDAYVKVKKHWRVEIDRLGMLNVPLTLAGLLETRFDTLFFPEKLTLQRASVIGRLFYDTALISLDAVDDTHLRDLPAVLGKLVERGFIYKRETSAFAGSVEYIFASAMLRDTLYDRLLERQRRLYHAGAAAWMAALEQPDDYLPLIADHYEKAGKTEHAATYLGWAGAAASRRGVYQEAIRFFERARTDLPEDADAPVRLPPLLGLVEAYNQTGNLPAARAMLEEALPVARSAGILEMLVQTLYQFSVTETTYGNYPAALAYLNEALPLARIERNAKTLANVLYGLANTHFRMGNDTLAGIAATEECLALCEITGDAVLKMYALNRLGTLKQKPGTPGYDAAAGRVHYEDALTLARQIGNRHGERAVLGNIGVHAMIHEHWQDYIDYTGQSLALAREIGDKFGITIMLDNLADGYIKSGQPDKAPPLLRESLLVAQEMASPARILSSLSSIGWYMLVYGDTLSGLHILGLVQHHPSYPADNFDNIQSLLENARKKLGMSDADFDAEVEVGKHLDLDTLVDNLLKNMPG